eukprot:scaffold81631_cov38-Attheya_sp.AAC.1
MATYHDKECAMVISMLQRKESRANAQSIDDNGDATHAPSSFTTNPDDDGESLSETTDDDGDSLSDTAHDDGDSLVYDGDSLSDTAYVEDNGEEEIPDDPVP